MAVVRQSNLHRQLISERDHIPTTFSNQSRLADQHRDQVPKSAQCYEKVQASDGVAGAENVLEEQAGCDLARGGELRFWHFSLLDGDSLAELIAHLRRNTRHSPIYTVP